MNSFFGKVGVIELKNAYNITATNFIKNLIFYGKRLVWIKDYKNIVSLIDDFNKYFLKFEISVDELEVKVECLGASGGHVIKTDKIPDSELKHLVWLDRWLEEAKYFQWLSEWLGC